MTTLTESVHAGAFMESEAPGTLSRETGTVASGQNLAAGTVIQDNGSGKLIACSGTLDSDGNLETDVVGILWEAVDASATGANADVPGCVYIARLAEVKDALLTYPEESSEGGEKDAVIASLKKLHIRPR